MKRLILSLIIAGVLLAAIGVGLWVDSNNVLELRAYISLTGSGGGYGSYVSNKGVEGAVGAGLAVLGGSMAISGWVMMIVRYKGNGENG